MSFAIIRNTKYKRENLKGIYRHNERRNKNYSNDNIDMEKTYLNYSLKSPKYRYDKEFDMMKERYKLKGQIKTVSNIACEYIITSDKQFFEGIGKEETKRYFETAYQFVAEYKNLGEQYIMSAKVHMDEETPHMHLIFNFRENPQLCWGTRKTYSFVQSNKNPTQTWYNISSLTA